MRERIYRTEALILRRSGFGEADRLLTIATPAGKRRVIAKGVRKTTSRIAGHIELFTHTRMLLATGRNLDVVTQSQVLESFPALRADIAHLSCAYYAAELYDKLTPEAEEDNDQRFEELLHAFTALNITRNPDLVLRAYELRLLQCAGYRPHLHHCAVCHKVLTEQTASFSPNAGGALCPDHAHVDPNALSMQLNAFKLLRYVQSQPLGAIERLTISAEVRDEVEQLLRAYLRSILERDLRSVTFLESLRESVGDDQA